jgi:hypothetical protein
MFVGDGQQAGNLQAGRGLDRSGRGLVRRGRVYLLEEVGLLVGAEVYFVEAEV